MSAPQAVENTYAVLGQMADVNKLRLRRRETYRELRDKHNIAQGRKALRALFPELVRKAKP